MPGGSRLQCATAGEVAFCPDRAGAIHRSRPHGRRRSNRRQRPDGLACRGEHSSAERTPRSRTSRAARRPRGGSARPGSRSTTTPPLRLSEDGSGATAVDLAARGATLARAQRRRAGRAHGDARASGRRTTSGAQLGEDAVVFVGGPGDRRTAGTLALPAAGTRLGAAAHRAGHGRLRARHRAPRRSPARRRAHRLVDVPERARPGLRGRGRSRRPAPGSARVRPEAARPGVGRTCSSWERSAPTERSRARDVVPTADSPGDVSLALGAHGDLWLAWVDASGSWVERLACR